MSRIATYARVVAMHARDEVRRVGEHAVRELDRLRRDPQCDDDDRKAIDAERDDLNRMMVAL